MYNNCYCRALLKIVYVKTEINNNHKNQKLIECKL